MICLNCALYVVSQTLIGLGKGGNGSMFNVKQKKINFQIHRGIIWLSISKIMEESSKYYNFKWKHTSMRIFCRTNLTQGLFSLALFFLRFQTSDYSYCCQRWHCYYLQLQLDAAAKPGMMQLQIQFQIERVYNTKINFISLYLYQSYPLLSNISSSSRHFTATFLLLSWSAVPAITGTLVGKSNFFLSGKEVSTA